MSPKRFPVAWLGVGTAGDCNDFAAFFVVATVDFPPPWTQEMKTPRRSAKEETQKWLGEGVA